MLRCNNFTSGLNICFEAVVKSCSRDPTTRTTSASFAIKLAAEVPVTPIAPTLIESFQLIALLPACVSPTGMPKVSAKSRRVSAACE